MIPRHIQSPVEPVPPDAQCCALALQNIWSGCKGQYIFFYLQYATIFISNVYLAVIFCMEQSEPKYG